MVIRRSARLLVGLSLLAAVFIGQPAVADEARSVTDALHPADVKSAPPPDANFLEVLAKDLGLSLLSRWGETGLIVPLAPSQWTLSGLRPYAAVSPRVLRPVGEGLAGLATPLRDSETDLSHGLGIGAGLTWRLSDRFDLFGEYLFRPNPGTGASSTNPTLRPDLESPGLKGGFSIHF